MIDLGVYEVDFDGDIRYVGKLEWAVLGASYYPVNMDELVKVHHGRGLAKSQLKIFLMYHEGV